MPYADLCGKTQRQQARRKERRINANAVSQVQITNASNQAAAPLNNRVIFLIPLVNQHPSCPAPLSRPTSLPVVESDDTQNAETSVVPSEKTEETEIQVPDLFDSYEESSSDESDEEVNTNLEIHDEGSTMDQHLLQLFLECHLTQGAMRRLLETLNRFRCPCAPVLPADPRTLVNRHVQLGGLIRYKSDNFIYIGIQNSLDQLYNISVGESWTKVDISLCFDGLPLAGIYEPLSTHFVFTCSHYTRYKRNNVDDTVRSRALHVI